ncbi:hypothetical protein PT974_04988 [Cladobotryum mycophilum]|uniref:Uncharacterized protein n=1 Tax=Cladobotryum mycophilum TaxID=491253 RepID=A0ABR0SQR2_9HYPO
MVWYIYQSRAKSANERPPQQDIDFSQDQLGRVSIDESVMDVLDEKTLFPG